MRRIRIHPFVLALPLVLPLPLRFGGPPRPKAQPPPLPAAGPASAGDESAASTSFVVERGEGLLPILLPREEKLVYQVFLDLKLVETAVGRVLQTVEVEPYQQSVLLGGTSAASEGLEQATMRITAKGKYTFYSLDSTIESRVLPQEWPRLMYRNISAGTEKRRKEIMVGHRDGEPTTSYRRDTDDGAPRGQRIWRQAEYRTVPEGTVDMLTALFFSRTLVQLGLERLSFPLIDKRRVWEVTLRRGPAARIPTLAGTFEGVELLLEPRAWPGEDIDEEKLQKFEGLFGLRGTLRLWAEKNTGILVRIQGSMPVGPIELGIDVVLERYAGTPESFAPVSAERLERG